MRPNFLPATDTTTSAAPGKKNVSDGSFFFFISAQEVETGREKGLDEVINLSVVAVWRKWERFPHFFGPIFLCLVENRETGRPSSPSRAKSDRSADERQSPHNATRILAGVASRVFLGPLLTRTSLLKAQTGQIYQ